MGGGGETGPHIGISKIAYHLTGWFSVLETRVAFYRWVKSMYIQECNFENGKLLLQLSGAREGRERSNLRPFAAMVSGMFNEP